MEDLKSVNIDTNKIILIEENMKDVSNIAAKVSEDIVLLMISPKKEILDVVINIGIILNSIKMSTKKYLVFIPGENHDIIEHMLATNVINIFNIESLNFDLIPIDIDLLSLERDTALKEIYIENDLTSIDELSCAFVRFENCFGKVKYKYIKGDIAQNFCKSVEEKENDMGINNKEEILGMIVLDRSVDFLTLICSNYTLEGLIDETIGINFGKMKIKESLLKEGLTKKKIDSNKIITYGLTTQNNPFYCSFRCMHYLDASRFVLNIKNYYKNLAQEDKNENKNTSLDQLSEITKEFNEFMQFKDKLIMLENILNFIIKSVQNPNYLNYIEMEQLLLAGGLPNKLYHLYDEHLYEKRDLISLIKLMIIESLTQNGIKDYQKLKREILNIYGYQNIFLFRDLETMGWLKEKLFLNNILNLRKSIAELTHNQLNEKFKLIDYNFDPHNIQNCSYVCGGYCPLSLRLIELAVEGKWSKNSDTIKKIQGLGTIPENERLISNPEKKENIIIIVFLGGITYTEIEGIRFLNRKYNEDYINNKRDTKMQFVIITTGILNSKNIFGNFGIKENPSFSMKQFIDSLNSKY